MATAVSAYFQPCRAHLASPASRLEEQYSYSYSELPGGGGGGAASRRAARCAERREAAPPEGSVRRTRDELARAARGGAGERRAVHVDAVCSKVEEVRKKFEGGACVSFSRSFESPPRRRLADSLFASFKLPRRRSEAAMASQPRSLAGTGGGGGGGGGGGAPAGKRKSAVELLAETKAFYVKSETVLDRKQELPLRMSSGLGQAIAAGGCVPVSSTAVNPAACCQPYGSASPARTHAAATAGVGGARRAAADGLQSTLRRLLNHTDSRENVNWPPIYAVPHKPLEGRRAREPCQPAGMHSGTSSSGTSGSRQRGGGGGGGGRPEPEYAAGDARLFFPEPQRAHHYAMPGSLSSPESVELPEPPAGARGCGAACAACACAACAGDAALDDVGAISPPAQYARSAHSPYVRSNSQSAATVRRGSAEENDCTNINSHKSLPDLHTHVHCYNDNVSTSGAETMGRSPRRRRHSAHQRTASCSSKGTRSNHSSLVSSCEAFSEHPSPGEDYSYNRCGSFARDSGGSSGRYTQRSAPPPPPPHARAHRTDSGSSGQHSHNRSHYAEVGYGDGALPEWTVSAPLQFQDGAPSPPPPPCTHYPGTLVGIHFQASAPPPQFQDGPPADGEVERPPRRAPRRPRPGYAEATEERPPSKPAYAEPRAVRAAPDDTAEYVNTTPLHAEEVTSPLGTFKRQRCLRYKQRRPRPILRSKSDISDSRYRRCETRGPESAPGDEDSPGDEEASTRLHRFFHTLGLDQRTFESLATSPTGQTESPVFFSDVSTVESNQLAGGADYTLRGPQPPPAAYRNTEPPSVVERNARIIKWLCNCRKQLAQ